MIEEFGKGGGAAGGRDAYFAAVFDAVEASLRSGGPLKGALFWQMLAPGQTASRGEGGGAGQFGVYPGDSTWGLARANAAAVAGLAAARPAPGACTPRGPPAAPPCADDGCACWGAGC